MLEVLNCVTPSPEQWQICIHGMRSAFKSWDKSDSFCCIKDENSEAYNLSSLTRDDCNNCIVKDSECHSKKLGFILGENDKKLLLNLTIILEVKAALYWWKQADKYAVGTTTNSESTMHTLTRELLTKDDFSTDTWAKCAFPYGKLDMIEMPDGETEPVQKITLTPSWILDDIVGYINELLEAYRECKDKDLWNAIIGLLPESYYQTRTWSLNYEVALQIIHQRKNHPLKEWEILIDYLLENIPLLKEIYEASCYQEDTLKKLKAENKELRAELKELKGETDE